MKEYPLVEIIVLNYNSGNILSSSFPTILKTRYPNLIFIIVDNGSNDESYKKIFESSLTANKNIYFYKNMQNLGCAGGYNSISQYLKGKYCVFLNEDIFLVDPDWLMKIVDILEKQPDIGAIGPSILNKYDIIEDTTAYFSKIFCTVGFIKSELIKNQIVDVPFIGLGQMVTRTELYNKIGMFREKYFLYWEDVDYCTRIWLMGKKVCLFKGTYFKHLHQGSIKRNFNVSKINYLHIRNSLLFFLVFYPKRDIIKFLLPIIMARIKSVAKAPAITIDIIKNLKWIINERYLLSTYSDLGNILSHMASLNNKFILQRKFWRIIAEAFK